MDKDSGKAGQKKTGNPRNRLGQSLSPYLLQHKDNPVDWRPWDAEALAAAQNADKPILLSVGYAACHWCHVMAHESFENPEIAALMNALFVNIKVDREERPDLDTLYQQALALLGQSGGWPLTMFLMPDGRPFWGGTYFPAEARWGRPGFAEVLRFVAESYRNDRDGVLKNVAGLEAGMKALARPRQGGAVTMETLDNIARRLLDEVDTEHGGIGGAPKFPQVPILELLWRAGHRKNPATEHGPAYEAAVLHSLEAMTQGGIYDHLGGGFARYAVDARWLVPHFEKMLYDNAELLRLMTAAWRKTRAPLFKARIHETVTWLLREMRAAPSTAAPSTAADAPPRAFAASLDADSEGEEGRFYVWRAAEIDAALGDADAAFFKSVYDVSPEGNWEGKTILNRLRAPALLDAGAEARLLQLRQKLFAVRAGRVRPGWDDKVLADWNGLAIVALVEAAMTFDAVAWCAHAQSAFAFIRANLFKDSRLLHAWRGGKAAHPATLDDYAHVAMAALALYEATGNADYLAAAQALVAVLAHHYWDADAGGYFFTADDTGDVILRSKSAVDAATPNGNATMLGVLARLYYLTGDVAYRDRAEALVATFSGELQRNFFPLATFLNAVDFLENAITIVLVGAANAQETRDMVGLVYQQSLPNRLLQIVTPGTALPPGHPAAGKTAPEEAGPRAYICRRGVCGLPVRGRDALQAALAELQKPL